MASNQSIFDQLNLSSGERRLVMVVLLGFVIVLAFLAKGLVPDPSKTEKNIEDLKERLASFQEEIGKKDDYQRELGKLKKMGLEVLPIEQETTMRSTINKLVASSGLSMKSMRSSSPSFGGETNRFFMEKAMQLQFSSKEDQLVNFLWKLGSGDSMIRVSSMQISPEKSGQRLSGSLTLTASYQTPPDSRPTAPRVTQAKPNSQPDQPSAGASSEKKEVKKASNDGKKTKEQATSTKEKPKPSSAKKATVQTEKRTRTIPSRPVRTESSKENNK